MISFPSSRWQSSLVQKTTLRRPRNSLDNTHGRVVSTITPRLYLSDLYSARAAGNLDRLGITHIVSAIEIDVRKDFGDKVTVMHVPIRDDMCADISQWFDKVVKFIRDALDADERHKVLVHCLQGISRSTTFVCAYLVATTPMRATEAIAHVQAKRGIAMPNLGFRRQLMSWERQFEDAKVRAAEERRRKTRSMGTLPNALSRWMGMNRAGGLSKSRSHET
ncbi:Protein-tyrosine phosphatase-like protein [Tylopilus felleus]